MAKTITNHLEAHEELMKIRSGAYNDKDSSKRAWTKEEVLEGIALFYDKRYPYERMGEEYRQHALGPRGNPEDQLLITENALIDAVLGSGDRDPERLVPLVNAYKDALMVAEIYARTQKPADEHPVKNTADMTQEEYMATRKTVSSIVEESRKKRSKH